ncbi:MAG: hypothetical protein ACLFPD_04115 [Desulfosudaceae bacterium]
MNSEEQEALQTLMETWEESPANTRKGFLQLKEHLEAKADARLSFKARPGISYSLRGACPAHDRKLFVMVDIIDDDPANRWLSVCFYGDMISDPEERGDLIPGGLLGEDGYCFDMDEEEESLTAYLLARIDEAYHSAAAGT